VRHSRANGSPRSTLDLPTGTVTFLITDIEGSTRILEQHSLAAASERRLREIGGATTVEMSGLEPPMLGGPAWWTRPRSLGLRATRKP
jgi:hypothetical protein